MPSPEPGDHPADRGVPAALTIFPVLGLGEVRPGDDLAALLADVLVAPADQHGAPPGGLSDPRPAGVVGGVPGGLADGDVLVVTQKVVSKSEGRLVEIDVDDPEAKRALVEQESTRVLRQRGDLLITETRHGFICANAGVDLSNVDAGTAALLPIDPDLSARRMREVLLHRHRLTVGVVISDTFGRPWRQGVTDIAIGIAGIAGVVDLRGTPDANGRVLDATEVCVADQVAGAAELVMGKDRGIPAAVVRGVDARWLRPASVADEIIRPPGEDLFR
jgi:coenzyme F420-0:L-glutamate ligase / coenzyme F420-1:gamma-L-glutamate ligase